MTMPRCRATARSTRRCASTSACSSAAARPASCAAAVKRPCARWSSSTHSSPGWSARCWTALPTPMPRSPCTCTGTMPTRCRAGWTQPPPAAGPRARRRLPGLAVFRGRPQLRRHRAAGRRAAAGAAVGGRRQADAPRIRRAAADAAGRGRDRGLRSPAPNPRLATPVTQGAPRCGAPVRCAMPAAVSARRCPRSRGWRHRCRSGAGGRCGFPGPPAAPASG